MSTISSRPFVPGSDLPGLFQFARETVAARLPGLSCWNPGDIAWQLGMLPEGLDVSNFVRLWEMPEGTVVGLAIFEAPLNFQFDEAPGIAEQREVAQEAIAWAEDRRREVLGAEGDIPKAYQMLGEMTLSTTSLESEGERIALLESNGYRRVERHSVRYRRSLGTEVEPLPFPAGMRFAHVTENRIDERVDVHRDAWSVWGQSAFSASRYRRLRSTPAYDETLDLVVEDADGRMLSCCICWFDAVNGIGHFEPVGTRIAAAGQGLARALVTEGLRRLQERGVDTAFIGTASVNEAAQRTYTACGFEFLEREHFYSKPVELMEQL